MKYGTQTRNNPPGFTFFANHPKLVDENYKRYLENRLREAFDFTGTPVTLKFRQKD
jgi:GTP-binding protein